MNEGLNRNVARLAEQLSHIDEVALVVLKGHLVLEEQLDRIMCKFLFHPKAVEVANLRFAQKIALVRGMSLDQYDSAMWELLGAINSLRNELAHALHSEKRTKKFARVMELYFAEGPDSDQVKVDVPEHELAARAIALVLEYLGGLEAEVDRFKDWVGCLDRFVNKHRHPAAPSIE